MRNRLLFYFVVMTTVNSNNVRRTSDVKKKYTILYYIGTGFYYKYLRQSSLLLTRTDTKRDSMGCFFFPFSLPFKFIMFNYRAPLPICIPFYFFHRPIVYIHIIIYAE